MGSDKTYFHFCSKCNGETPYVSAYSRPMQIAFRTWKIVIFFLSFAMLYPHTFTADEEFTAKCTKCGRQANISYE
ncbi:MAG: hypothetical protein C0390_02390 [Syntrophus sp. (in: bacteria)]|nr:hypothetical protein [Syntrophus sp. (in: bacteria)]